MKLQYLCHMPSIFVMAGAIGFMGGFAASGSVFAETPAGDPAGTRAPSHDYPTVARVEYVNECIGKNGGKLAALYQCSCAIDRIANALPYDDYVEASTYAKYSTLAGQAGAEFRDSEQGRKMAKNYRELEAKSLRDCGVPN